MKAVVETFFRARGFGFGKMTSPDNIRTSVFFHIKDVVQGDPVPDAVMEFDLDTSSPKGPIARNIRITPPVVKVGGAA